MSPVTLAIPKLFDAVTARFFAEGTLLPMYFGWNESATQLRDSARVVWIPGDEAGNLGRFGPPKYASLDQLMTLYELVTLEITGADITDLTDERKQYQIVRELHDVVLRAVHLEAVGTYSVYTDKWVPGPGKRQRRFGATLRIVLAVEAPITADTLCIGNTASTTLDRALIEAYELDVHESVVIERED